MYEYKCIIVSILDGDTVDVDLDLGFGIWLRNERVRFHGIDTPESRTKDKIEKVFGTASKKFTEKMIPVGSTQVLQTVKPGAQSKEKFGRILGKFKVLDEKTQTKMFLNDIMIRDGYAVGYEGDNKSLLEQMHKDNRKKLILSGVVDMSFKDAGLE
jgi:micrococcal nuclease